jgi:hypothetical protein
MTGNRRMIGACAIVAVLAMMMGAFAAPVSAASAPVSVTSKLTTDTGTTTDFGGGDYFYVRFGADAAFGIVWGTNDTPNNVYFVAIMARYLGMAQVYDQQGNLVLANHTVKIYTVYAVKLEDMLEFGDINDNGVLQYHREYVGGNFTGNYISQEPIYKKVDLKTAWTQSAVSYQETNDSKTWSFGLSATDLGYVPLNNYTGPTGDDKLNELTLTFHLSAKMVQVNDASIPQWRVTVQRGMMGNMMWFYDAQRMADLRTSGKVITYHVKWDQAIEGWDFDSANTVEPSLLMEFGAILGNYVPQGAATWMTMNMVRTMNEYGAMNCRDSSGDNNLTDSTGTYSTPRPLASPRLTFGANNTRIGALEWVSNVTVDGAQDVVHAQIMGGIPVWSIAANGALFGGFAVLGGIAFPGGALIVHDPTFSSEALVDLGSTTTTTFPSGLLLVGMVAVVIVLAAVIALVLMEKKPGQKNRVQQSYERTMSSQPGEWAKYYNKK